MAGFYRLMAVLIEAPWLAAVPGAVFLGLWGRWAKTRRRLVLAAAIAWLAYVPYEYGMKLRILCSGECNIRVDLLLLYPVLLGLSILAVVSAALALRQPRR